MTYKFKFSDDHESKYVIDLNRNKDNVEAVSDVPWTQLDFNKCENCPLNSKETKNCPPAIDVERAMHEFQNILSSDIVKTYVETNDRTYYKECDAQTSLKALMGLIMATSLCPILKKLKGLAFYHLPFASFEETIFRAISDYLLKQYFKFKNNKNPDWSLSELSEYYEQIQMVNVAFFERIKVASKADANLNAVVSFSSQSQLISFALDEYLENLAKQFSE
ncbi:hypothetical protein AXG55_10910 [Silvanigrella aquatica]|uniref:Uncharacterized protein n=1 Tax=Silvanigrella aquatica TaxID=1915309 RepID=A0A1L4D4N5_9BACT|nr:hypothetical protein AXG55_10910 [Silvanigrella aquatica]